MNTELREKERIAIERLKAFEPEDGYFLAYSGGKDSDCIKLLTLRLKNARAARFPWSSGR